jgi:hypothetical protein
MPQKEMVLPGEKLISLPVTLLEKEMEKTLS